MPLDSSLLDKERPLRGAVSRLRGGKKRFRPWDDLDSETEETSHELSSSTPVMGSGEFETKNTPFDAISTRPASSAEIDNGKWQTDSKQTANAQKTDSKQTADTQSAINALGTEGDPLFHGRIDASHASSDTGASEGKIDEPLHITYAPGQTVYAGPTDSKQTTNRQQTDSRQAATNSGAIGTYFQPEGHRERDGRDRDTANNSPQAQKIKKDLNLQRDGRGILPMPTSAIVTEQGLRFKRIADGQQTDSKQIAAVKQAGPAQIFDEQEVVHGMAKLGQQTDSEQTANGQQTDSEQTANGQQTDSERIANRQQTDNKQATDGQQTDSEQAADRQQIDGRTDSRQAANRQQTDNGLSLYNLSGLQRNLVMHFVELCKAARTSHTPPLSIKYVATALNCTIGTAKSTLLRLTGKGFISISASKTGRGGWSEYTLPEPVYRQALEVQSASTHRQCVQTDSKQTAEQTALRPSSSSRSLEHTTSTTGAVSARDKQLSVLFNDTLSASNLSILGASDAMQAWRTGKFDTPEDLVESLEHLAHYITTGMAEGVDSLKAFAMRELRKGYFGRPAGYLSPQERAEITKAKAAEEKAAGLRKLRLRRAEAEFECWYEELAETERTALLKSAGHEGDFVTKLVAKKVLRNSYGLKFGVPEFVEASE